MCRGGGGGGGGGGKGSETEGVLWVLLELKQHPVLLSGEQITMAQVQVVQSVDLSGHRLHHHNNSSLTKRCSVQDKINKEAQVIDSLHRWTYHVNVL